MWTPGRGGRASARRRRAARVVRRHRRAATSRAATSSHRPVRGRPAAPARGRGGAAPGCSTAATARLRPGLDDKVLTEWNAMMISAAGRGRRGARPAADWRRRGRRQPPSSCWPTCAATTAGGCGRGSRRGRRPPPRLRRRPRRAGRRLHPAGRGHRRGPLDRRGRGRRPTPCSSCSGTTTAAGSSPPADDAEQLIVRSKDLFDNATPSANSVAAVALLRLGRPHRRASATPTQADRVLAPRWRRYLGGHPTAFTHLLAAVDLAVSADHRDRRRRRPRPTSWPPCSRQYLPNAVLAWGERVPLAAVGSAGADGLAYVCRNYACQAPGRRRRRPAGPTRQRTLKRKRPIRF